MRLNFNLKMTLTGICLIELAFQLLHNLTFLNSLYHPKVQHSMEENFNSNVCTN